jgi:hypothetical protein
MSLRQNVVMPALMTLSSLTPSLVYTEINDLNECSCRTPLGVSALRHGGCFARQG